MNKEIYKKEIDSKKVNDITITDNSIEIIFDDEVVKIGAYHEQDCCEHVYADFSVMKYHRDIIGAKVRDITIKSIEEMGFLICFCVGYDEYVKVFIACYNSQNGYYSSNLELIIENGEVSTKIDISDAAEDLIN